jgi:hypothetical protein
VPGGDPVHGIGVVRYMDAVSGQLVTKSYRPGSGYRRGLGQIGEAGGELLGPGDERLPDPRALRRVQGGEDLAPVAVEDGEALALRPRRGDPGGERVERADASRRDPEAGAQPAGGGDPDPQAGERARPEADRDQVDRLPAARRARRLLDLGQQAGRVAGPPLAGEPQQRFLQDLAVAPGAGGGVDRRGVEADDDQGLSS